MNNVYWNIDKNITFYIYRNIANNTIDNAWISARDNILVKVDDNTDIIVEISRPTKRQLNKAFDLL